MHQFRASRRTKSVTCRLLMPRQRIMPKNRVRCATLLLMLLEIISTPANKTRKNIKTAVASSVCPSVLPNRSEKASAPCLPVRRACSIRAPISAMLKMAVTMNTAKTMQSCVIRFCRRWTRAEIGIRLR